MPASYKIRPRLVTFFIALVVLSACGKKPVEETTIQPELWLPHLEDYTQGWIPAAGIPQIRFSHPVIKDDMIGKPLDGIVKFNPEQDITVVFTTNNILEIRHEKNFPSNQEFEVILSPDRLLNMGKGLPALKYNLKVLEQSMNLREIGLVSDPKVKDGMVLEGELTVSDSASFSAIEKILSAKQQDIALNISWKHIDEYKHQYSISGIVRKKETSRLTITWDAQPIGIKNQGERDVEVPAMGIFSVTSIRTVVGSNNYIEARFSEPLDARQKLDGLVKLNGIDARPQIDGSVLRIYGAEKLKGEQKVHIEAAVKNSEGVALQEEVNETVVFIMDLPQVRFAEKGHIMPPSDKLLIPVEAVAVNAIQVKAFEIYPDNMGQYLQENNINYKDNGSFYSGRHNEVGRYLWQKKITLPKLPQSGWERYDLDVSELIANKNGSLIRLELEILPQYSIYPCENPVAAIEETDITNSNYDGFYKEASIPEDLKRYYASSGYYSWNERENPCHAAYYSRYGSQGQAVQTFFASNLGILAKQGEDNTIQVLITSLRNATAMENVDVTVFNYQQQPIGKGKTDQNGLVGITLEGIPFYIRAQKDKDSNYLKVPRNQALSTSQFNTGGTKPQKGMKGFFYGERDIWRPGDDIFLTFILMDKDKTLPANYPLTLEFFDPRNGKVASITNTKPMGSFYTFNLKTLENAPTGSWRAIIKIGDFYFDRVVRLENISPNRLKMDMDLPSKGLHIEDKTLNSTLQAQWLTGASAATFKADVQAKLSSIKTVFSGYDGYSFDDKARSFSQEPQKVFEGNLDAEGKAVINAALTVSQAPPGMLNVALTQRVFEPGGQFSSQYRSVPFYPFATWVGMRAPSGNNNYYGALDKNKDHNFDLLTLDSYGKPLASRKLEVNVYSIEWRWWWDADGEDFSQYISGANHALLTTETVTTDKNGYAQWILSGKKFDWGRHFIRICDAQEQGVSQHCVSQDVYLGWGYGQQTTRDSATRMALSSDKERYQVGDIASIHLPDGPDRKVFVSIENGSRILAAYWQDIKAGNNSFTLPVTSNMTPNVYIHVTQLQPHQQSKNDLPLRIYGIVPVLVDDPATHLKPLLTVPEKIRPESKLDITVAEQQGQPMTYTVAIVDEGLLGISDYKTPDPHDTFYKREALGVVTWDLYDLVVGAYGADLARLLAVGGSDALKKRENSRERRFPPIVQFIGPFQLAANASAEHSITLPAYMGAVRVMVVAGNDRAYGRAEKTVTVTQPLVILSTLPRVLGPGEEVNVPVNIFVSEAPVGDVTVSVLADDFFTIIKGQETLSFTKPGENVAYLRLKVKEKAGMAKLTVRAQMGAEKAQETLHIPVRSANQPSTRTETHLLKPGEEWQASLALHGMHGTNNTSLTVSTLPELKLEERLNYLIGYPHGCIEQTTSSVFPQLYLPMLMDLNQQQKLDIENNVNAAIKRIGSFQTTSGGFSYWPYQNDVSPWGSNYAGHFLLEAKQLGYSVPADMLKKWLVYQREQAKTMDARYYSDDAYRLYTLALANQADTGAMNRLREKFKTAANGGLSMERWMLALAYQQIGQNGIAQELLEQAGTVAQPREDWWWTYGSDLRDRAVLLMLRYRLGQTEQAWELAADMAGELSSESWYSTQTTAWSLLSIANTFGTKNQPTTFSVKQGGAQWQSLNSVKPLFRQTINGYKAGELVVRNSSKHPLYVALANRGTPANTTEIAENKGLTIAVDYTDMQGTPLTVDQLPVGQDFIAQVTVHNTTDKQLDNLALTQVVPSGWQVSNSRLEGMEENPALDYLDIGDDRQVSFFSLSSASGYAGNNYWWRETRRPASSITVKMVMNASFSGRFYLPGWQVEPMYDGTQYASTAGKWVEVKAR